MTTMTLRLDEETYNRLSGLSNATDRSKTYLAIQALRLFLEHNEWQVKAIKQAVNEANSASEDQFIDHESVVNWMDSWGSKKERPAPL